MIRTFWSLLTGVAIMTGCSQPLETASPTLSTRGLAPFFPVEWATPDNRVAVLLAVTRHWRPETEFMVLADGAPIDAEVHGLRLEAGSVAGWTSTVGRWTLGEPSDEGFRPGESALVTISGLPNGVELLTVEGAEVRIESGAGAGAWPNVTPNPARPGPSVDLVRADQADPFRAWRVDLAQALAANRPVGAAPGPFGLVAMQNRARWQAALLRLEAADAHAAARLMRSLGRVVSIDGIAAPAWSADGVRLARLLDALLAIHATPADLLLAARTWLADEPTALAWVVDDGGEGRPALFGVANLTEEPATASVAVAGVVELAVIEPFSAQTLVLAMPAGDPTRRAALRVGSARFELDVVTSAIASAPPGVRMGPLLPEWSMGTWLGEIAVTVESEWATAALLQPAPATGGRSWELFLDCRAEWDGVDSARVVVGNPDSPTGEARVARSGVVEGVGVCSGVTAVVRREPDRWTATLRMPATALADSIVALSLERIDARGARSTWPRQVMPWQTRLPGASIDLSTWGGATTTDAEGR